ncbi:MAG: oxidoreductase [Gemmatimonadetes bacterium]|nr:oxidoreductase [Gemmatimonadota bacterium]
MRAAKHAARALYEGLHREVKPYDIRASVISPGAVATEPPDSITETDISNIHGFHEAFAIPADPFARLSAPG